MSKLNSLKTPLALEALCHSGLGRRCHAVTLRTMKTAMHGHAGGILGLYGE